MKISNLVVCLTAILLLSSIGCGGPEKVKDRVSREKREKIELDEEKGTLPSKEFKMRNLPTIEN